MMLVALAFGLHACQDGVTTTTSPAPVGINQANTYSGPVPATADVQAFKTQLWDNLRDPTASSCGNCHFAGGQGTPFFVRDDDVNLAYQAALPLINRTEPKDSSLVTKVANNQNCWVAQD